MAKRLLQSPVYRFAVGAAAAVLGASFTIGAMPALAAQGTVPKVPTADIHPLVIPPAGVGGISASGGMLAKPFVGAATRVTQADLAGKGGRTYRALPAKAGTQLASTAVSGGAYFPLSPTRLLDTRTNGEALGPNASLNLTVTGGSVPADATAVALNVTVTDTTAAGYLSVYPAGGSQPVVSNLNWTAGATVPNLVIVPVGASGQVTFYNHTGQADVVADLEGYFAPETIGSTAGSYVPLTPARITDTRSGSGYPNAGSPLSAGSSLTVQVTGAGGVPSSGVTAALMNVTVTDTTAASFLTVYPSSASLPTASNLNWTAGETVANRVVVPVGPTGEVTVYNHTGTTNVIVDVNGYFTNGSTAPATASLYVPITPVRVLDTRQTGGALGAGSTLDQQIAGVDGIGTGAAAAVTNVTAVDTTAASYFTVYPTGGSRPTASDVNWSAGQVVPNLTVATLSAGGSITVYNYAGSADVVIDAFGYFLPESSAASLSITTTSLPGATVGTAYSATLGASGGTPPYSWAISSGALPSGLTLSAGGVISGTPTTAGTGSFGVTVTDSSSPTPETAAANLEVVVAAASVSVQTVQSDNWSGYAVENGPYTAVQGTFSVSSLVTGTPSSDLMDEWVGIDGASDADLIQAGIMESMVPCQGTVIDPTGPYNPDEFYICPWTFLIMNGQMQQGPLPTLIVNAGDSVTVTIWQVSGTDWAIKMADQTTGGTWETTVSYSGPQASAEWIVEAPGTSTLAEYSPDVTFTQLGMTGPETVLEDNIMVQGGTQVSTPSILDTTGFNVAYGDVAPSPP